MIRILTASAALAMIGSVAMADETPAPPQTLTFTMTTAIPMPTAIEVDGTVICNRDGTVLRCRARPVAPPVVAAPEPEAKE